MKRIFAIGDIHGCFDKLDALLSKLPISFGTDLLVFLGDYIDRGPESRRTLETVIMLKGLYPDHVICLKGNHEWMFSRYLAGIDKELFLINGGLKTLKEYSLPGKGLDVPVEHKNFINALDLFLETDFYIFVHAGLRPGKPLSEQNPYDILWIREPFISSDYDWGKRIIFGHTPFLKGPFIMPNKIGIDTGAVYGRKLTALIIPDMEFIST